LEVEITQGREGGDGGERGARLKLSSGERRLFHRGQRYIYLYNPESPGQVRNIWETWSFRPQPRRFRPPESSEQIFKEFGFVEIWNNAYVIYVSLSSILG
jgi:hypothetical protein